MRRNFYFMLVAVLSMLWSTPKAFAEWVYVDEDNVTPAKSIVAGKMYILESVSNQAAKNHYLTANTNTPKGLIDSSTVWIFDEHGTNAFTGEKQYALRSVLGGWIALEGAANTSLTQNIDSAKLFMIHGSTDENAFFVVPNTNDTIWFTTSMGSNTTPGWDANSTTLCTLTSLEPDGEDDDGKYPAYFLANWWANGTAYWGYRDTNPWNLWEVEYNVDGAADLQAAIDEYDAAGYDKYPHGDDQPFGISTAAWNRLQTAYTNAIEAISEDHTFEEYKTYEAALRGAVAALSQSGNTVPMKAGYYYLKTAGPCFLNIPKDVRAFDNGSNQMRWNIYPAYADTTAYVWRMEPGSAEGTWSMQNMSTGRYMDGVGVPSATAQDYTITVQGGGKVSLRKNGSNDSYQYLHCNEHGGGSGNGSNLTGWTANADASLWYIAPVTDQELIARLEAGLAQKILDTQMAATMQSATNDSTKAMVTGVIGQRLVTSADQLYGNNRQENEGSIPNLLDGNTNTYYHSAWQATYDTDDNYHYMQFNSPTELPSSIKLFYQRRMNNNNNRPTKAILSVSSDGTNWTNISDTLTRKVIVDTLTGATEGVLPTVNTDNIYFSEPFNVPAGMTRLRFTVFETNNNALSPTYRHPFITFSEFNVYPGSATYGSDASNSQALREDMAPVYQALVAAMAKARGIAVPTQADIDELQAAVDAFDNLWVDSTALVDNVASAKELTENAHLGSEVGEFSQDAVDQLKAAVATAEAAAPYFKLTKVNFDATADALQKAIDAFQSAMNMPEDGWYYIVNNVSEENRKPEGEGAQPTRGQVIYTSGYDTGAGLSWGGLVNESEQNGRAIWAIKSLGDGTYAIQSVAAGWYMGQGGGNSTRIVLSDTIVPYKFVSLGEGQIGLRTASGNPTIHAQWANKSLVNWGAGANSASSWLLQKVSETSTEVKSFTPNRYYVVTVPYTTSESPYATNGEATFYDVVGVERNGEGLATAVKLAVHEGGMTGGKPVVMHVGEANEGETVDVDMMLDQENTTLVTEPVAANGLYGALQTVALKSAGYGYLTSADSIQATVDNATRNITAQEGYFVPQEITEVAAAGDVITLPIAGQGIGTVNAISKVVADDPNAPVNVYTIDGVLVKKNVKAGKAAQGLQKGLYIIGRTKVLVK